MNKQDIIEMLNLHLTQLTDTANGKNRELHQQLTERVAETKQFLAKIEDASQLLTAQLTESEQLLMQLQQPLDFSKLLDELLETNETDIAKMQHQLAEKVHQHITEFKAETVASEQALMDKMVEIQHQFSGKTHLWADWREKIDARFGKQIQWAKEKLAAQLIFCADKLKA